MRLNSTLNPAQPPHTTIVVPAYNEAARLDVASLDAYLASHSGVNFILVNDGSTDGTLGLLQRQREKWPNRVHVLDLQPNRGKSEAVRQGMLAAFADESVDYVGFWDADWATPLDAIDHFIYQLETNDSVQLVIGSRVRLLGRHIDRKPLRHYVGRVAATMASMVLGLAVYDTQCGAKLLRANGLTKGLFGESFGSRWVFDVELIARYLKSHPTGDGIYEQPLDQWRDVGDSKVRTRDVFGAFGELLRIHRRYRLSKRYGWMFDLATSPVLKQSWLGLLGTLAQYATLVLAVELGNTEASLAAAVSAAVGAAVNYVIVFHLVSQALHGFRRSVMRTVFVAAAAIAAAYGMARWGAAELGLHYVLAQVAASICVFAMGLVVHRR